MREFLDTLKSVLLHLKKSEREELQSQISKVVNDYLTVRRLQNGKKKDPDDKASS